MLQFIRDHAKGWIAWGIVIFISIPFAVWGVHNYLTGGKEVGVAQVNGTEIGLREFQQQLQRQRGRLRELLGVEAAAQIDDERMREATLEQMIENEVLVQSGARGGMRIGDAQLALAIRVQQAFSEDGRFSQARYEQFLRRQGYSPGSFEEDFRRQLLVEQIANGVRWSGAVSRAEVERMARLAGQRRRFSTLVVSAESLRDPQAIDEAAVRERYQARPDAYMTPEQVRIAYVLLSRAAIAASIEVSDEELRAYYEAQKANYMVPERRRASHILIRIPEGADAEAIEAARKRIEALAARLRQGASFADLARESSEDPGSAGNGGDLGYLSRGTLDPAMEKAAFALRPGEVSEPIRTRFGWHLIKVTAVEPARGRSFEEAREEVLAEVRAREAEQVYFDQVERLANLAFESPESLEPVAEALGVEIVESALFSRDGKGAEGVVAEAPVIAAAFAPEVLIEGTNSEPIELEGDRVVVLRVIDHREAKRLPLEAVAGRIRDELAGEAAAKAAAARASEILERLRAGASPEDLAAELGATWSSEQEITRNAGPGPELTRLLFAMARPSAGTARYDALQEANGDVVIVRLVAVEDGEVPQGEELERARKALMAQLGEADLEAFTAALIGEAKVERFTQNVQ